MKYLVSLFLALHILSGCGATKQVSVKPKTLPSWYTQPQASTSTILYALGEGETKKEAIAEALSFMASTLSVKISSSYNAKTVVKEGTTRNSSDGVYRSEIQSDVAEIRISNYEVIESQSLGFKRYAVVVKSDKRKLFQSMKQELDQKFLMINKDEESLKNADALKKLVFYRESKNSLTSLPNTLIVMNVLNPSFEGDEYIRSSQILSSKYQDIVQNISFSVLANSEAQNLRAVVSSALSEKRLRIKESKSEMHYTISIHAKIERADAYGFTLARTAINFTTKNSKGAIVGTHKANITGQSSQGYAIAKQNLSIKLTQLIKKEGIAKVLGLDI